MKGIGDALAEAAIVFLGIALVAAIVVWEIAKFLFRHITIGWT